MLNIWYEYVSFGLGSVMIRNAAIFYPQYALIGKPVVILTARFINNKEEEAKKHRSTAF